VIAAEAKPSRSPRPGGDKFAERRRELAEAAIQTLSELGYARTSLREIAQNSAFSHGVLHYYFADKVDLITYCVRQYKAQCVLRYDQIGSRATTPDRLAAGFADDLVATVRDEGRLHRLWFDLRSQALFDDSFRADVLEIDDSLERMIWRIVSRYAEMLGVEPTVTSSVAYAMFDGAVQMALLRHLAGQPEALAELRSHALLLLAHVTCTPVRTEAVS
jgi:AcrR family transcriptional regulator